MGVVEVEDSQEFIIIKNKPACHYGKKTGYTGPMKLRHILTDQKYMLEDVLRKLQEGKSFEAMATAYSKCSSAQNGGDLGKINPQRLDDTFYEFVEHLKLGERTGIFRTRFGYHIAERYE